VQSICNRGQSIMMRVLEVTDFGLFVASEWATDTGRFPTTAALRRKAALGLVRGLSWERRVPTAKEWDWMSKHERAIMPNRLGTRGMSDHRCHWWENR
jgi:hypothetical protein